MTPDDLDLIRATIARGKPISAARARALVEAYERAQGQLSAAIKDLTVARDTVAVLWLDLEELKAELATANAIIAGLRQALANRTAALNEVVDRHTTVIDNDHASVGWDA